MAGHAMIKQGLTSEKAIVSLIKKNSIYQNIKKIGISPGWGDRPIFICEK